MHSKFMSYCFHRVNQSAVRIHADVLLVAEVPLVALFDGMSFRITLLFFVDACPNSSLIRLLVNCFFTSLLYLFSDIWAVLSLCGIALIEKESSPENARRPPHRDDLRFVWDFFAYTISR